MKLLCNSKTKTIQPIILLILKSKIIKHLLPLYKLNKKKNNHKAKLKVYKTKFSMQK